VHRNIFKFTSLCINIWKVKILNLAILRHWSKMRCYQIHILQLFSIKFIHCCCIGFAPCLCYFLPTISSSSSWEILQRFIKFSFHSNGSVTEFFNYSKMFISFCWTVYVSLSFLQKLHSTVQDTLRMNIKFHSHLN